MSMSFLAELLGEVLQDVPSSSIPEVELPDEWKEFEQTLAKFKKEYTDTRNKLRFKNAEFNKLLNDTTVMNNVSTIITSAHLQEKMKEWISEYKTEHNFEESKNETYKLFGIVNAMERVLINTNAKRYSQFTCSICMERTVDTFLDPCGHLVCERCMVRSATLNCPICRRAVQLKKMYPTME
jgi:hypothetical protein